MAFVDTCSARQLNAEDFSHFYQRFVQIYRANLPTVQQVYFVDPTDPGPDLPAPWTANRILHQSIHDLGVGVREFVIDDNWLLLRPHNVTDRPIIIVATGADPIFTSKVDGNWLLEAGGKAERECLLVKQARVDHLTGLRNLYDLFEFLDSQRVADQLFVTLIELPSARRSFRYNLRYAQQCTRLLRTFFRQETDLLYHLGNCCFAVIRQQQNLGKGLETHLVEFLKREGCFRVHVGASNKVEKAAGPSNTLGRNLLDQAWSALDVARKRGPFSFCDYSHIAYPQRHPFAVPSRSFVRQLSRIWAKSAQFSLVCFHADQQAASTKQIVRDLLVPYGQIFENRGDCYLYLENRTPAEGTAIAVAITDKVAERTHGATVSAGISSYPLRDYHKSATIVNCRKALAHASFYGPGSVALFDATTLNISGDVYYGEGDLAKALHEYRKGIELDPENVNLHNSLGVTLVMMNKMSVAMRAFEQALQLDGDNFMALYNLGLAKMQRKDFLQAFNLLKRADNCYDGENVSEAPADELPLYLGELAGEIGRYEQAIRYLHKWGRETGTEENRGRICYPLGRAYFGLGDHHLAMVELQRALRFNEFDDRAMHLLGRIYFQKGEGDDIALSLCRKSVELAPDTTSYRLHLAAIELHCGNLNAARDLLYRCLQNRQFRAQARFLLGKLYFAKGQHGRARNWFVKVAENEADKDLRQRAKQWLMKVAGSTAG